MGVVGALYDPKSIDNRSRTKQCHYKLKGIAMSNENVFIFFFRIALIITPSNLVPRVLFFSSVWSERRGFRSLFSARFWFNLSACTVQKMTF